MGTRRSALPAVAAAAVIMAAVAAVPAAGGTTTGFSYLKIGAGARSVALGDAVVSHVSDASANYWNPGAIALMDGWHAELMHNESFQNVRYEFVSLTRRLSRRHSVGLFFNGVWTDNLRGYNERGEFEGHFGYYGVAAGASYAFSLTDRIGIGAGVKLLQEAMDEYSAGGPAFNLGIQAREPFARILPRTDFGLSVRHLGGEMEYEAEPFDLPTAVQGGVTHTLPIAAAQGQLLLAAEFRTTRGEDSQFLVGTEYRYQDAARLQVGYLTNHDTQDVSFGVGVGRGVIKAQYSFVPFGEELGEQHRLSVLLNW